HPRPQARPPAATRLDARAHALRPHCRGQHLYHRRTLSTRPRRARLPGRTLHPRLASLRLGKTPGQGARRQAVGTDIAHAVPLTLVGGIGYWLLGTIDWDLPGSLLIDSLPGILVGSYFSARVPEQVLRLLLSGTLIAVGSGLLF